MNTRTRGLRIFAVGMLCWAVNAVLLLSVGMYGPMLVILGALAVFAGLVLLVWGDSFRTMTPAQKVPAALIALALAAGPTAYLLQRATHH